MTTTITCESSYRDFSHVSETERATTLLGTDSNAKQSLTVAPLQLADDSFPSKLHYVLNELEKDGLSNIAGWAPNGRCFMVFKQYEFVEQIQCQWFRQTKYASFQRQLNIYGFKRITTGPFKNHYYHELFLRGKPLMALRLERVKTKGTGRSRPSSREADPDFSKLPVLPSAIMEEKSKSNSQSKVEEQVTGLSNDSLVLAEACALGHFPLQKPRLHNLSPYEVTAPALSQNHVARAVEMNQMVSAPQAVYRTNAACYPASTLVTLQQQQAVLANVPPFGGIQPRNLSQAMFLQLMANRQRASTVSTLDASEYLQQPRSRLVQTSVQPTAGRDKRLLTASFLDEALKL